MAFWMELWNAIRLEERLVLVEDLPDFPFPQGLDAQKVEDILKDAPTDFRFHLSSGALASFLNTLPLLHQHVTEPVKKIFFFLRRRIATRSAIPRRRSTFAISPACRWLP